MADKSNESTESRRGPSASLLIVGLLALGVSAWAFVGPSSWPTTSVVPVGWIVVLAAIIVGIVLVVSPRKRG
ncbi:hypothetical protein NONI108955_30505 [Nocardia ninae]|uniref:Uncharacterized protein n=1 Tax=Nocardia ninae NBRC 108245 TaxID=1210091 RepID=A0A511MUR1_9NOCA|nr:MULTISPECIES: hypothetical protein [Nocardia]GEM44111.1 hypothetical protein NN4_86300 [Nocardia ninae NBRC 108245]